MRRLFALTLLFLTPLIPGPTAPGDASWPQFRGPSGRGSPASRAVLREGDTFVVNAGDTYDEVAKNSLAELAFASPAVTLDGLFVRTEKKLYRIKN
jgi:hypothetical protein